MNRTPSRNLTTRNNGEFLVYQTDDGRIKLDVRLEHETLWLTQKAMTDQSDCNGERCVALSACTALAIRGILQRHGTFPGRSGRQKHRHERN